MLGSRIKPVRSRAKTDDDTAGSSVYGREALKVGEEVIILTIGFQQINTESKILGNPVSVGIQYGYV